MASERTLPPIRLPFTVKSVSPKRESAAEPASWGKRIGLWWDDGPEGYGVIVTGTIRSGAPASGLVSVGDLITAADGQPIGNLGDLAAHLDRFRGGRIQLTVRNQSGKDRSVLLNIDEPEGSESPGEKVEHSGAKIPHCSTLESLEKHIEMILGTPRQGDVLPAGVPAEPEFGCLGAGLDFAQAMVPHGDLRAAIRANENRLEDVEIESIEQPDPTAASGKSKTGIVVKGRLIETGESIRLEYRFEQLSARRSRATLEEHAGIDDYLKEGENAGGS